MEKVNLGQSDLKISPIVFGAWAAGGWMWGSTDRKDAIEAIRAGYEAGVTTIDTAPVYGQGESESIVGEAIKAFSRDKVQILTKYGMRWDLKKGSFAFSSKTNDGKDIDIYKYSGPESIIKECEDSLQRLRTDYIDLYQIHWPDDSTPIDDTMAAVQKLIQQGKVRYAGVCNYNAAQVKDALTAGSIISDQVPYSILNRGIEDELVPYCSASGIGILAYSPMERGLLTGKIKPDHEFAEGDHRKGHRMFTNENILRTNAFLKSIKPVAETKNITLGQLILRWTLAQPGISAALAGARNKMQSLQNAGAMHVQLKPEEIDYMEGRYREHFR